MAQESPNTSWELLRTFKVRDLMTEDVHSLSETDVLRLWDESEKWRRFRHIPVVDNHGKLVGLVSHRDLMNQMANAVLRPEKREQLEASFSLPVKEVMLPSPQTIGPEASLIEAAHLMYKNEFGALPVLDLEGRLLGILTEADFVELVHFGEDCFTKS